MSLESVALGPLVLSIVVYVALVLFMLTTRPVEPSRSRARKGKYHQLPLVLRPVGSAISCVVDMDERDWTWKQYTAAVLLLALLTVLVMALLTVLVAGLYMWIPR
jgi:K+-transporting ATPase A subunit